MKGGCLMYGIRVLKVKNWVSDNGFGPKKDDSILLFTIHSQFKPSGLDFGPKTEIANCLNQEWALCISVTFHTTPTSVSPRSMIVAWVHMHGEWW
jgi:hypothetical protein